MKLKMQDFTVTPVARNREDGPYSGQEYFEKTLLPAFIECKKNNDTLTIDMDGTWGYASSFLSSAFGRLFDKFPDSFKEIQFISKDDPYLVEEIKYYMTLKQ